MSSPSATASAELVGAAASKPKQESTLARTRPLILARGASAVMTFAIPLCLARLLSTTEYGTYKQFVLVSRTLYAVLPFGVVQSLYYFLPRGQHRRAYLGQTHLFVGVLAVLSLVGLAIWGGIIGQKLGNPELSHVKLWLGLYAAGLLASLPFEITFTARGKTRFAAWTYVVSDAGRTAAMTLPVLFGFGLVGLCIGLAAWATARWAATLLLTMRGESGPAFTKETWKEQWKYALPFGVAMAVAVPQNYFHQYAVSASVDAAAFAVYSVGCFELPLIDLLYMPTTEILMVRIGELDAEGRTEEGAHVFRECAARLMLVFIPLALFLFASGSDFITTLFSEKYRASAHVFRIAVWAILLAGLPVDGALRARKFTGAILQSYVVKAIVAVPLVLLGLHLLGIIGAILAWVLGEVVGKALLMSRLPRAMESGWSTLIPWKAMGQAVVAAVAGAVVVALLSTFMPPTRHLVRLACEGVAFTLIYAAGLAALGARPLELVLSFVKK